MQATRHPTSSTPPVDESNPLTSFGPASRKVDLGFALRVTIGQSASVDAPFMSEIVQGWVRWAAWARFAPELLEIEELAAEIEADLCGLRESAVEALQRARVALEAAGNRADLRAKVDAAEASLPRVDVTTHRHQAERAVRQRRILAGLVIVDC